MARWLLLLCTAIGLTAMHTLGHGVTTGHDHVRPGLAASSVMAVAAVHPFTGDAACPGDHCPAGPGHGSSGGWSVCLAILTGLAVVVLMAGLLSAAVRRGSVRKQVLRGRQLSRAPPTQRSGLTITATTVLRI